MHIQSFHEAYRSLLTSLLNHSTVETNARTGVKIKMIEGAWSFKMDLHSGRLPIAGNRAYFPHVAAAEAAWQFQGTQDPTFILKHAPKLWSKFVEDGELKTAYGYRWRVEFGRDQLMQAVDCLENDPTNRQLWVQAWDPANDGLGGPQPKNIPCPLGFSVSRSRDVIHMSVFVRSSDVFVGLPYDVMAYALTLDAIAAEVNCRPGTLHFTLHHPHLYEPHWGMAKACSSQDDLREGVNKGASYHWTTGVESNLPGWSISEIEAEPDGYVAFVKRLAGRVPRNKWNPLPEVIE